MLSRGDETWPFELASIGIVETEMTTGRFLRANPAFCEMVGYSEAELQTMTNVDLTHPDNWERDRDNFAALQLGERTEDTALTRVLHKDGHEVWLELSITLVGEGEVSRNIAVVNNVTERIRAEGAVRESEEKYRTLFDAIDSGFLIHEMIRDDAGRATDLRMLEVNPAFTRQTGLGNDMVGKLGSEFLPNLERFWLDTYDRVARTGTPERVENYNRATGRWYNVHVSRAGGNDRRVAVVFEDVSERKQAEQALRDSEEQQVFLLKLADTLRAEPDADALANRALQMLVEQLQLDRCYIASYRLADDRADITHQAGNDHVPTMPDTIRLSDFPAAFQQVFDQTLVIDDSAGTQGLSETDRRNIDSLGLGALVAATLRKGEHNPLWVIVAVSARPRRWTPGEITLIEEVTERTWAAVERVRAEEALKQLTETLEQQVRARTQELSESEQRYRALVDASAQAVWVTDTKGMMTEASPSWTAFTGQSYGHAQEEGWLEMIHPDDYASVSPHFQHAIQSAVPLDVEARLYHAPSQTWRWVNLRAVALHSENSRQVSGFVGMSIDIHERKLAETARDQTQRELKRANEQLYFDACHDTLTGLPNRVLLNEKLKQIFRNRGNAAVLFMDLDRFKVVNDSLGHTVGDSLLVAVAEQLRACIRPQDMVTRFGGDEFVVLLEDITHMNSSLSVAKRIHDVFDHPLRINTHSLHVSTSIGVVPSLTPYTRVDDVLRDADTAMYRAKAKGGRTSVVFTKRMRTNALKAAQLERELRTALVQSQLQVFYQPIFTTQDRTLISLEALLRWRHPTRGLLRPQAFFPLAEEVGLATEMEWWVWDEACRHLTRWHQVGYQPLKLNLNLSAQQFHTGDLPDRITKLIENTGVQPQHLYLEVTEQVLLTNSTAVLEHLKALKVFGCQLYLDDFGTGYSSLSYLQRFPFDGLKIDRAFVGSMLDNTKNYELVRTIIRFARTLDMNVVAEGVETKAQLERLKDLGCEQVQGFLLARPQPAAQVERLLAKR